VSPPPPSEASGAAGETGSPGTPTVYLARPERRGPLRLRPFGYYLGANIASWAGLGIADVLFLWLTFERTGSAIAVAYVGIAMAVPAIALGFPAGVLADRIERRRLLLLAALFQAAAMAAAPLTLWVFGFHLLLTLVLVLTLQAATVIFRPAANALLPALVRTADLEKANGHVQAWTSVAVTAGAAAAAFLLTLFGVYQSFVLDFGMFLAGGLLTLPLLERDARAPIAEAGGRTTTFLGDLREAFRFLRTHLPLLENTVVSVVRGFFVAMFSPFLIVYVVEVLHQNANSYGYLIASFTAGYFVGSLAVDRLGVVRYYGRLLVVASFAGALLLGLLVLVPQIGAAFVTLGALGLVLGLVSTAFFSFAQRVVPSELLGRYLSIDETLAWTTIPLAMMVGGLLVQFDGVPVMLAVAATGLLASGVMAFLLRGVRSLRAGVPGPDAKPAAASDALALGGAEVLGVDRGVAQPPAQPAIVLEQVRP
jgi:MFS family permease